jgi:CelD/BcsL family acetyltransferase involved in cellulose biosynthesis
VASTALASPAKEHRAAPVPKPRAMAVRAVAWGAMDAPDARLAWDALAACASEPNPFHESWYLLAALRALDPEGSVKLLRFEADGELAGILPLHAPRKYYRWPVPHLASWAHANCFLGAPLVARGLEQHFWRALLDWADEHAGPGLFLHLAQLPLTGVLYEALQQVLHEQGRLAATVHREDRAMLASDLSPESYFEASMSGKKRKELRRQFNRLSELGEVAMTRTGGDEHLARWIEQFLALEHSGWKGTQGSALASHQATTRMFKEALFGAAAQGRLERLTLTLDDEPIAMLANFITAPGAYSYKTAFDERFARYSPGVLVQRENLALLSADGIDWCDSCAAADHPMIDHIWRERRPIGRLSIAIGGKLRRGLFARLVRAELRRMPTGI